MQYFFLNLTLFCRLIVQYRGWNQSRV